VTYADFLVVFLVPPVLLLAGWLGLRHRLSRRLAFALGLTSALAVVYTGPWDALVVAQGVWSYPSDRVVGATIGLSRVEEYAFFVLQVLLAGLLARALLPAGSPRARS
jgi:lycopene cyclase domain-containing protein